jgi:UPF0271 protein
MKRIDLNCDMGELPAAIADGTQRALMPHFTSINIACGGHAGDDATMRATIAQSRECQIAAGAHPGYPDRVNFGRVELALDAGELAKSVYGQVLALSKIADELGVPLIQVKAHGALYNQAAKDSGIAAAFAAGIARWKRDVIMIGLAGSSMLEVFQDAGFRVAAEAFADRRYQPDGSLRPRKFADALINDPDEAGTQAVRIVERGSVVAFDGTDVAVNAQTICIHGDGPNALAVAAGVAQTLRRAGIELSRLA